MPSTLLERLVSALRACKTLLEDVQPTLQGPGWLPPIEVVRADEVLDELASTHPAPPVFLVSARFASIVTRIELFGTEFERLARFPDQVRHAAEFSRFAHELMSAFDFTETPDLETGRD